MVETRSRKMKRQRLMSISSQVSSWPDLPARFESLNDDALGLILQFVGNKSYRSFGGLNYHCNEIYLSTEGMEKETFVYGYAPLSVIQETFDRTYYLVRTLHALSKGVVRYNRKDVLDWVLEQNDVLLKEICNVATEEGRIYILEEVWKNIVDEGGGKMYYVFYDVDEYAAYFGKLKVLKWLQRKGISIHKDRCAYKAAQFGHIHILQWLREEKGLELSSTLYTCPMRDKFHVMEWLKEQGCPWNEYCTFRDAAYDGNLDVLQWLHDAGCPWSENDYYHALEWRLKPDVIDWLRTNGYSDKIV